MSDYKGLATDPEMEKTFEQMVLRFMQGYQGTYTDRVDVCAFAEHLHLKVIFANLAGNEDGVIRRQGFLSDGKIPVGVMHNGEADYCKYPIGTIVLERRLRYSGREEDIRKLRFTLAHECAHWVMGTFRESPQAARRDMPHMCTMETQQEKQQIREDQADRCAAIILMPRFLVMKTLQQVNGGKKVPMYGDDVLDAEEDYVVQRMADALGVNYMPMRYRLGELDLYEQRPMQELIDDLLERMYRKLGSP